MLTISRTVISFSTILKEVKRNWEAVLLESSLFRRTLLSGIQHVFMVHLLTRPSYEIVFFAAGRVATRWYRALKLKACSCRAGTSLVVLFPVYYLPVRADFPRETMGKRRIKRKGKEEGRRIEAGSSVS